MTLLCLCLCLYTQLEEEILTMSWVCLARASMAAELYMGWRGRILSSGASGRRGAMKDTIKPAMSALGTTPLGATVR